MTFTTTPRRLAKTLAIAAGLSFVSMSAFAGGEARAEAKEVRIAKQFGLG
mgnify:CR=1 FL=1